MLKDYYAVLGVSRSADTAAIHSAFRALARRYHPDVGRGASVKKFTEALEAYQTLSHHGSRHQHDIDLGKSTRKTSTTTAEPLFQDHRYPLRRRPRTLSDDDDPFIDLLRWMESELGSMW